MTDNKTKSISTKLIPASSTGKSTLRSMGYILGKTIGVGTYSKVLTAYIKSEKGKLKKIACKKINKTDAGDEFIEKFLPREIKILVSLEHRHIIKIIDVLEIKNVIYLFMEYCSLGDLLEYLKKQGPLTETKAKFFFKQLVSAIKYLHDLNIVHRDIKCENVLLYTRKHVKLADFGFARHFTTAMDMSKTFCGSAAYAAPEILQGIPYNPKMYDVWALGCVLYIMITASMPFDDSDVKKMIKSQLNSETILFNSSEMISPHLKILLGRLLEPKAQRRATIKDVVRSSWLKEEKQSPPSDNSDNDNDDDDICDQ